MQNKLFLFFVLISFSSIGNAQIIGLQKNGTDRLFQFRLPKLISFDYQTDSGVTNIEANAVKYEFPFMELRNKQNSIQIDVRKINKLKYKSRIAGLYYLGAFTTSLFSITVIVTTLIDHSNATEVASMLTLACFPASLSYIQLYLADRKFNTKKKWSFVNPRESSKTK